MTEEQQAIVSIEKALDQGHVFQAHNIASELLLEYPDNLRLSQLKVIALNRLGQPDKAIHAIEDIIDKGYRDGETMGLLGRTYKDLYKLTKDTTYLQKAAEAYYSGYQHSYDYYPGVNAASLYHMLGNREKATQLSHAIIKKIGEPGDYWSTVTLGEAWLILGDMERAKSYYEESLAGNDKQFGKFRSTFNQLQFLGDAIDIPDELSQLFPKPNLAVFSGHMIDTPGRSKKRFPPEIEQQVRYKLKETIKELDIDIGFTSLASGGDILFAELLEEKKAEIKAYLPFRKKDFISTSVAQGGLGWINRFEHCYDCTPKFMTTEPYLDTPDLYHHLGQVMMGECMLLAEQYGVTPYFISILAPNQENKLGGTQELSGLWPYAETHHNIDPTQFHSSESNAPGNQQHYHQTHSLENGLQRRISNILFADIVGFSKLLNEDTPVTILSILDEMNKIIAPYRDDMQVVNTWGDAIILCHEDNEAMMQIACDIQELFKDQKAQDLALPSGLNIRIALHKGPVFLATDPLTGEPNVFGSSINRTARMEPVTLPGSIYTSDQFAAALKLDTKNKYQYQHMGIIELPKGFGKQEVYKVSPY